MLETVIEYSRYFAALLFGAAVSASLAGMEHTRKNYLALSCFTAVFFVLQIASVSMFTMDTTLKLYPLLSHLPVFLYILIYLRRSWMVSLASVFVSYLCCQPPRWVGSVMGAALGSASANHIGYIAAAAVMYYLLQKYVINSARYLIERSVKSCLLFAAMPAFYYVFDFAATVYTDFLYTGNRAAVQFMPFVTAAFYLVFVLLYYIEAQKQLAVQRERDILDTQLRQAHTELASLRRMHRSAAAYRHDMRHHLALLQNLAAEGRLNEIREYLYTAEADINAITPSRWCENETVNLILSAFAARASQAGIHLTAEVSLAGPLPFSDTELCSLLSNALENAIQAAEKISDSGQRHIKLRIFFRNSKLCIDIRNTYQTEPLFRSGLPVSAEPKHSFGTKSMVHIVENHGGVCRFSVQDGWFIFQATA